MEKFAKIIRLLPLVEVICEDGHAVCPFKCVYCGKKVDKSTECYRPFVCGEKECIEKYKKERKEYKRKCKDGYCEYLLRKLKQ